MYGYSNRELRKFKVLLDKYKKPIKRYKYEDLEKHFIAPKENSPYNNVKRIPRKLKKKVKKFCWVHWAGESNDVRLWYYLEESNNDYKTFLIKKLCISEAEKVKQKIRKIRIIK